MSKMHKLGFVGVAALLMGVTISPLHAAGIENRGKLPPKHDSNTLHKLGNAIQYPVRKMGENVSIGTHRTTGENSVVKDQMRGSTEVVKPSGNTIVIAKDNPSIGWINSGHRNMYMHRRQRNFSQEGRKYYWFQSHRYYLDLKTGDRIKID